MVVLVVAGHPVKLTVQDYSLVVLVVDSGIQVGQTSVEVQVELKQEKVVEVPGQVVQVALGFQASVALEKHMI
jgi:hypothetical protein